MMKRNWWLIASVGGILISIISLFLPIMKYHSAANQFYSYNVSDFVGSPKVFVKQTLSEYTGEFLTNTTSSQMGTLLITVSVVGILAIVFAAIGIVTLSQQKKNVGPFIMALLGLIGTAVPSVSILVMYFISFGSFRGSISLGAYSIVTPIAMVFALIAVTYKRRATLEQIKARELSSKYIYAPKGFQ